MTGKRVGEFPVAVPEWNLQLFDSWHLTRAGAVLELRTREQRLVALLALQGGRRRSYLAGILWPESTESRAGANLRAATFRIDHAAPGLLVHDRHDLALSASLRVDVTDFVDYVWRLSTKRQSPISAANDGPAALKLLLHGDLLPGWYDDWVIYERARLQQLRVQALEVMAARMIDRGNVAAALVAASAAVAMEPLRESAQRLLMRVHIHEGNYHAALRDYREFSTRLRRELGITPSTQMQALVRPLLGRRRTPSLIWADSGAGRLSPRHA